MASTIPFPLASSVARSPFTGTSIPPLTLVPRLPWQNADGSWNFTTPSTTRWQDSRINWYWNWNRVLHVGVDDSSTAIALGRLWPHKFSYTYSVSGQSWLTISSAGVLLVDGSSVSAAGDYTATVTINNLGTFEIVIHVVEDADNHVYIDPDDGDNGNDGRQPHKAIKDFGGLPGSNNIKRYLKRGTTLRQNITFFDNLEIGTYGDPTAADPVWRAERTDLGTVSFTNASNRVTITSHGLSQGDIIWLVDASGDAVPPTGLAFERAYYVKSVVDTDTVTLDRKEQLNDAATFTDDGSGTIDAYQLTRYATAVNVDKAAPQTGLASVDNVTMHDTVIEGGVRPLYVFNTNGTEWDFINITVRNNLNEPNAAGARIQPLGGGGVRWRGGVTENIYGDGVYFIHGLRSELGFLQLGSPLGGLADNLQISNENIGTAHSNGETSFHLWVHDVSAYRDPDTSSTKGSVAIAGAERVLFENFWGQGGYFSLSAGGKNNWFRNIYVPRQGLDPQNSNSAAVAFINEFDIEYCDISEVLIQDSYRHFYLSKATGEDVIRRNLTIQRVMGYRAFDEYSSSEDWTGGPLEFYSYDSTNADFTSGGVLNSGSYTDDTEIAVDSIDGSTDIVTTSTAHGIAENEPEPVWLVTPGTLPSTAPSISEYSTLWGRYASTTTLTLHANEDDALTGADSIDFPTVAGGAGSDPAGLATAFAYWEFFDGATVWADTGATTAATTSVARVDDQVGSRNLVQATSARRPRYDQATRNGKALITFDGATTDADELTYTGSDLPSDATIIIAFQITGELDSVAVPVSGQSGYFPVALQDDLATSPNNNSGTPTYAKNGSAISSPDRNDLWDAFVTGMHIMTIDSVDLSAYTEFNVGNYVDSKTGLTGHIAAVAILDSATPSDITDAENYMISQIAAGDSIGIYKGEYPVLDTRTIQGGYENLIRNPGVVTVEGVMETGNTITLNYPAGLSSQLTKEARLVVNGQLTSTTTTGTTLTLPHSIRQEYPTKTPDIRGLDNPVFNISIKYTRSSDSAPLLDNAIMPHGEIYQRLSLVRGLLEGTPPLLWYNFANPRNFVRNSSGLITSILDQSGNGYDATLGTGSTGATWSNTSLDGARPAAVFDGDNGYLIDSSIETQNVQNIHVFAIQKPTYDLTGGADKDLTLLGMDESPVKFDYERNNRLRLESNGASTSRPIYESVSYNTDYRNQVRVLEFESVSGQYAVRVDGNDVATSTATNASSTQTDWVFASLLINGGGGFIGSISDFVIYEGGLTEAQRQIIQGGLCHMAGSTAGLPSDHPYKTLPPWQRFYGTKWAGQS